MYYRIYSVTAIPGNREEAIQHLKKLAQHASDAYGISSEVVSGVTGAIYRMHISMRFDSMAHIEEVEDGLFQDQVFGDWFKESIPLLEWTSGDTSLFVVH